MDRLGFRLLAASLTVMYVAESVFVAAGHQHCAVGCSAAVECCGHHDHERDADSKHQPSQRESSPIQSPGNDSDDCVICHYLAQATVPAASILSLSQTELVQSFVPAVPCRDVPAPISTRFSRGPPA